VPGVGHDASTHRRIDASNAPTPRDDLSWPDFGVPEDPAHLVTALSTVLRRARTGQRVEVGRLGRHGRTGTDLACLAVLSGHCADDAVAWVRANYCAMAVETPEQEAFAAATGALTTSS